MSNGLPVVVEIRLTVSLITIGIEPFHSVEFDIFGANLLTKE